MNLIIQQIYPIHAKGGAAKIITNQFVCTNSIFQNILTQTSAIFDIKTKGLGVVKLNNVSSNLILSTQRDSNDNFGCININSQNSKLDLEISNSNFTKVENGMSSAILSVKPSQRETTIQLRQIQIINCFSFLNQIFQIEFSNYNDQKLNQLSIRNMNIIFDEVEWIIYLSRFGQLSSPEIAYIIDDNSIINMAGGLISINSFALQGIIISPILKILNAQKLEIRNCFFNDVKSFYSQQLIILNQQLNTTILFKKKKFKDFRSIILILIIIECQLLQLSQLSDLNSILIINENIKQFYKLSQRVNQLLISILSSNSELKLIFNQVKLIQNNCLNCSLGLFFFSLSDYKELTIFSVTRIKYKNMDAYIQKLINRINSLFISNNGSQGSGIQAENIKLLIRQCKILGKQALKKGGGIQLDINKNEFNIYQSIIMLNKAKAGGGISFQSQSNLNKENFQKFIFKFQLCRSLCKQPY
ncbi:unnamed protein product [Paramecium octaurelia]|uniref:Uncharacterized protein n=1 Tax=Paramecium octaurelia TaxID=43137 RepID=A0A8S1XVQ8_PAROT|nr:unnamed protein product [Paramecium octaurelia]